MRRISFSVVMGGRLVFGVVAAAWASWAACAEGVLPGRTQVGERTDWDRDVAASEASHGFKLEATLTEGGSTTSVLRLTSQRWLTEAEVDRPVWQHWLSVIRPPEVKHETGFLMIGGGSSDKPVPATVVASALMIARATESVVAVLSHVPAQPLVFAGESEPRSEDLLVASTGDRFLRTGDEWWPVRLPMTKAAVRAMDAVTSFCAGGSCRCARSSGLRIHWPVGSG